MFADISFSTEAIFVIGVLLSAVAAALGLVFKLLMASKDKQIEEQAGLAKTYRGIAEEAVKSETEMVNWYRQKYEGKPPLPTVVPVVPEGNSPPTKEQRDAAHLATMRAQMAMIKLETGQEPRAEPTADGSTHHAVPAAKKLEAAIEAIPEKTATLTVEKLADKEQ